MFLTLVSPLRQVVDSMVLQLPQQHSQQQQQQQQAAAAASVAASPSSRVTTPHCGTPPAQAQVLVMQGLGDGASAGAGIPVGSVLMTAAPMQACPCLDPLFWVLGSFKRVLLP